MTRLLLVCPEPLGRGQPAGIGIRFLEMVRVLRNDGHDVVIMSPDGGAGGVAVSAQAIADETSRCGAAIVQGHAANELLAHGAPLPTVVDLYDPYVVENLHYFSERGPEVYAHDHATLMRSVLRGDFFLCASQAQRTFYLGYFLATGRLNPEVFERDPDLSTLLAIAPFGVHPPRARAPRNGKDILFGGIYDWYDPVMAIDAVAIARRTIPEVTLTFTRHPNPDVTPQGKTAEAMQHALRHDYDFIRFEPWTDYDGRGAFFDRFALALLTFPQSIETDLSMRTRIYDYLWGGIPIVTSSAPGTDEILERYEAGSVLRSDSAAAFAAEIVALLSNPGRHAAMQEGADRFVADHQWERVLAPLREFCRHPRFDRTRETFAAGLEIPPQRASLMQRLGRRIGGRF